MKVVCDNCGAKYQVDDDKVSNKVFKFRCKRCSHIVIIRPTDGEGTGASPLLDALDSGAAEAELGPEEATSQIDYGAHQEAPEADGVWHVVVNREQVGPLTREEVLGYLGRGEINADTFGWREGMADWERVGSIAEFADDFGGDLEPAEAEPDLSPEFADASHIEGSTEMFSHDSGRYEEDGDVLVSGNVGNDDPDPFGAVDGGEPSPFSDPGGQLRGQRNENSVLFSLDALEEAERARDAREAAASGGTGGAGGSGLIDMAQLGGAPVGENLASNSAFGAAGGFNPAAGAGVMPSLVTKKKSGAGRTAMIIAAAVVLLAGVSLAAYFAMSKGSDAGAEKATVAAKTVEVGGAPKTKSADATPEKADAPKPSAATSAQPAVAAKTEPTAPAAAEKTAPPTGEKVRRTSGKKKSRADRSKKRRTSRASSKKTSRQKKPSRAEKAPEPKPKKAARAERRRAPAKKGGDDVDDLLGALDGAGSSSKSKAKPKAKRQAPKPSADSLLPKKLTRNQILSVVKKNARSVTSCKDEGSGEGGTVVVYMVVGRNGAVSQAKVKKGKFKGTSVGRCVERKVKRFRFPQFSGKPLKVNMPFRL